MDDDDFLAELCRIARDAGQAILEVYDGDFAVRAKDDASPVTDADERAEEIILKGLAEMDGGTPVLAEESAAAGHGPLGTADRFWLVDPLDGTKEFVKRNGEFTVNIALIIHGAPVLGVVHAPTLDVMFQGGAGGAFRAQGGAEAKPIHTRHPPPQGLTALVSRTHADQATSDYLSTLTVAETLSAGSSLKFCRIAEGRADVYPRLGPTNEWDTGAGHAVLAAAGGRVETLQGTPLRYGKTNPLNPFFIAWGR